MQKTELTQPETIDFSEHPELISSFKTILGEVETVLDILQREQIDFELFLKISDGLLKDFRVAINQYPEAQLFYEQNWDNLHGLESIPEIISDSEPEYIEGNREYLIEQFKQIHQCIQVPILQDEEYTTKTNIHYIPQGINNDLAVGDDQLSIEDEIQAIADVLLLRQLQPPIAVGILGTWGSGKSFGMHLMQKRVNEIRCSYREKYEAWGEGLEEDDLDKDKKLSPYVGHIYQIKFNAWSYAKSNLWASLMEEIFSELNQQITFERQLEKAGVDLLTGGKIWEALEKLNEGDRQYFLQQHLDTNTFEKLKKIELQSELKNELMTTLRQSQNQALLDIEAQEEFLKETTAALKERQCEIAESMNDNLDLALAATPELIQKLHKHFGQDVELKITERIRTTNPDFDPQKVKDIFETVNESINLFLGDSKPDVFSTQSLTRWLQHKKVWLPLLLLIVFIFLCVFLPLKVAPWVAHLIAKKSDVDFWKMILGFFGFLVPGTPAAMKFRELLRKFNEWSQEARLTLHETRQQIQQQMQLEIERDPTVKDLHQKAILLKKQIEQKRQQLPELQYDSLPEFLGDRLKPENYSNHLGMINQVQKDLQDLSNKLLPPKEERTEKIKELFPRGEPRIFLYIDDLDRCPPDRVVEVLEAVQLLLNTPLFVVVLAVDDRYVARALEDVYAGVLKRRGKPSGIDYLEKIIQIPYRMRPISADTVAQYLSSQIQIIPTIADEQSATLINTQQATSSPVIQSTEASLSRSIQQIQQENIPAISSQKNDNLSLQQSSDQQEQNILIAPETPKTIENQTNINEINTIEQAELDLIVDCCKYVDITPRTGKRLINIYKILKIVWDKRKHQGEPSQEIKRTIFSFLALSGRYPDFMRHLFEEIDTEFQELPDTENHVFDLIYLLYNLKQQVPKSDSHAQREWRKFSSDIKRMISPNPFTLDKSNFQLALAFCFVGDIGYDPDDFSHDSSPLI